MYTVNSSLRNNFAYVPQGNSLISGSIKYNILLGNPNASDEDIRKALHTAGADFVLQKRRDLKRFVEKPVTDFLKDRHSA